MALFKKTVFNMTQVENESLSDMIYSCLVHFGELPTAKAVGF